jgi:Bacterial lectin/Secretion system C-terminal sorting domain
MRMFYSLCMLFLCSTMVFAQDFQKNGSTNNIQNSPYCFQLTPPNVVHVAGSVWSKIPIDLTQNFTATTKLYFGIQDNGADGLAFVFQNAGLNALGIDGGGLGYYGIPGSSFIVEFDTYQNLEPWFFTGDPVADHIGFMSQGDPFHNHPTALLPPFSLAQNIEDGQWHDANFSWDATAKKVTVSFGGQNYVYSGDIVNNIFGGNPIVYWGFTAATGSPIELSGATQSEHRVCIVPPSCGQLRTQTPGGWGADPHGDNPGTYLHAHFASVFPGGLLVGDFGSGKYAKFTNAQAITDYLPAGGPSKVLTKAYINPKTEDLKNTLVMHLAALTLSVKFDQADPSFGDAGIQLGNMIIGSGVFANKTVSEFLALANNVLAGLNTTYTPQQVLDVAAAINENYVDGKTDNKFLKCPEFRLPTITSPRTRFENSNLVAQMNFNIRPNPSRGQFEITSGDLEGKVRLQVIASNGAIVQDRNIQINKGQSIGVDLTRMPQGMYMVRLSSENTVQMQKLVIQR